MMRRGRVFMAQQASGRGPVEGRQTAGDQPPAQDEGSANPRTAPEPSTAPTETAQTSKPTPIMNVRGRAGRILSQMAAASRQAPPASSAPEPPHRAPSSTSGTSESGAEMVHGSSGSGPESSGGSVSRRGSDASNISQHFSKIKVTTRKVVVKERSQVGQPVDLSLNYMTFNTNGATLVEEYHVDFSPPIESIRLRYAVLRTETARAAIGEVMHWNGTNLYLPVKLPTKQIHFESAHPSLSDKTVKVKLTWIKTPPECELIAFYNGLMHKIMNRLKYVVINRQHYSPLHKIAMDQHRLEVWPGWVTSVQRLDDGIKLAVDASFKVLRMETVRDVMMEIKSRTQSNLKTAFEQELIGAVIMTRYNNRPYRIDGIELKVTPAHTFIQRGTGREITYKDYMKEHWNVDVRDDKQPMIIHVPKPRRGETQTETVYLIPELCVCTGITDNMRANYTVMKAISDKTKLPPRDREAKLKEFLHQLATDDRAKSVFSDWNLSVSPDVDIVQGRRIDTESILFGQGREVKAPDNVDWTRPATNGPVFRSVDITDWVIMYTDRDAQILTYFMDCVKEIARILRINFSAPRLVKLHDDSPISYVNAGKREVKLTDQMVVILTPGRSQREDRYSACKRLFSCDIPVPCQFIRSGIISNPSKIRSIVQKIVIQILSKVGGAPWGMKMPMKSFMIVGIDVYHDTLDRKKSCVAFVASQNDTASRWWSTTFFQDSLEEIGQRLNATFVSAMKRFHQVNGFIPQKIIVYRDGVGDGQIDTVINVEVAQVMNSVMTYMRDNFEDQPVPQLSYLVVQKRINAKLSLRLGGQVLNPMPGTYLDHTITHPEYNDFFLVSQHVREGTVSPTKYILVTETGKFKLEHHQRLAYKMTYMYYNWCGTIRVPAPCQYAHKLAYLTGQNIRQQANDQLAEKLYYL